MAVPGSMALYLGEILLQSSYGYFVTEVLRGQASGWQIFLISTVSSSREVDFQKVIRDEALYQWKPRHDGY